MDNTVLYIIILTVAYVCAAFGTFTIAVTFLRHEIHVSEVWVLTICSWIFIGYTWLWD